MTTNWELWEMAKSLECVDVRQVKHISVRISLRSRACACGIQRIFINICMRFWLDFACTTMLTIRQHSNGTVIKSHCAEFTLNTQLRNAKACTRSRVQHHNRENASRSPAKSLAILDSSSCFTNVNKCYAIAESNSLCQRNSVQLNSIHWSCSWWCLLIVEMAQSLERVDEVFHASSEVHFHRDLDPW